MRTQLIGTGKAVPSKVMTNHDIEQLVDTSNDWIVERTGIQERRILEEGRTTSDLAAEAGKAALQAAGISAAQLDAIICATISPDSPLPAAAVSIQQKLGAHCPAFDIAAACAGFIYGMTVADGLIRTGGFNYVLVIGVEILSRVLDWTDRNTCVLFGDGAGAAVLCASPDDNGRGILSTHIFADGAQAALLNIPAGGTTHPATHETVDQRLHFVKMQGRGVFVHAVRNISRASQIAMEANGVGPDQIDWVIAHQANLRIIESVAEKCRLPLSKFYLNIQKYGNTSSASIPIALDEAVREGKVQPGQLLLLCALGAGFSWGSAMIRW